MKNIFTSLLVASICVVRGADIQREVWKSDKDIDEFYKSCVEERGSASQHEALDHYLKTIAIADSMPADKAVPKLGEMLRKLSRLNLFQVPERGAVYDAVQEKLLSIPGHAQYFANEIERLIADPANIGSDIRERLWYIQETLPHLPSPETIRVLGNYLYDERHAPLKGHDNSGATGQSCYLATNALRWIGLRESEDFIRTIKGSKYSDVDDLQKCRTWWEEVKSGKRTFSFKGQALEYRFKPDGTWDTIPIANPPDDGPKATTGITSDRPVKRNAPAASETQEAFRVPLRWWYGIGGAVLLGACAWLWRKTTTR